MIETCTVCGENPFPWYNGVIGSYIILDASYGVEKTMQDVALGCHNSDRSMPYLASFLTPCLSSKSLYDPLRPLCCMGRDFPRRLYLSFRLFRFPKHNIQTQACTDFYRYFIIVFQSSYDKNIKEKHISKHVYQGFQRLKLMCNVSTYRH